MIKWIYIFFFLLTIGCSSTSLHRPNIHVNFNDVPGPGPGPGEGIGVIAKSLSFAGPTGTVLGTNSLKVVDSPLATDLRFFNTGSLVPDRVLRALGGGRLRLIPVPSIWGEDGAFIFDQETGYQLTFRFMVPEGDTSKIGMVLQVGGRELLAINGGKYNIPDQNGNWQNIGEFRPGKMETVTIVISDSLLQPLITTKEGIYRTHGIVPNIASDLPYEAEKEQMVFIFYSSNSSSLGKFYLDDVILSTRASHMRQELFYPENYLYCKKGEGPNDVEFCE